MSLFGASLAARKAGTEMPEDGYVGEYIREWAAEMPDDVDPAEWGYERVKQELRESLSGIGVEFDNWFSELSLVESGAIAEKLADPPSPAVVFEEDAATRLRPTDCGGDTAIRLGKRKREHHYHPPQNP